jgi:hypothetical protein
MRPGPAQAPTSCDHSWQLASKSVGWWLAAPLDAASFPPTCAHLVEFLAGASFDTASALRGVQAAVHMARDFPGITRKISYEVSERWTF